MQGNILSDRTISSKKTPCYCNTQVNEWASPSKSAPSSFILIFPQFLSQKQNKTKSCLSNEKEPTCWNARQKSKRWDTVNSGNVIPVSQEDSAFWFQLLYKKKKKCPVHEHLKNNSPQGPKELLVSPLIYTDAHPEWEENVKTCKRGSRGRRGEAKAKTSLGCTKLSAAPWAQVTDREPGVEETGSSTSSKDTVQL